MSTAAAPSPSSSSSPMANSKRTSFNLSPSPSSSSVHHSHSPHSAFSSSPVFAAPSPTSLSQLKWDPVPLLSSNPFDSKSDNENSSSPSSPTPPPIARTYFTMIPHNNRLWIFGGFGDAKGRFNDLFSFNCENGQWTLITPKGDQPKPIYLHSAISYNHRMYILGGITAKYSNELFQFDFDTYQWSKVAFSTANPSSIPSPRYGHAAVLHPSNGNMYIVGGCRQNSVYYQDMYCYDFRESKWKKCADAPVDVAYHTLWYYQNSIYLFGGYNGTRFSENLYTYNAEANTWTAVKVTGTPPPPSCGCAVIVHHKYAYVYGGYTANGHTNNSYRYNMDTKYWESLSPLTKPTSRAYLQSALVNDSMFIFGGYDGSKCVTDFRMMRLPVDQQTLSPNSAYSQIASTPSSPSASLNMAKTIVDDSVSHQLEIIMRNYARKSNDSLDRKELFELLTNIRNNISSLSLSSSASSSSATSPASPSSSGHSHPTSYPFDTSRLQSIMDIGFTRDHVIRVMTLMSQKNQDTSNQDLVVDRCLNTPQMQEKPTEMERTPSIQSKEKDKMSAELKAAIQEKEDSKCCTICYENQMNALYLDCGHLTSCIECARNMEALNKGCPVCRVKITKIVKVYWT